MTEAALNPAGTGPPDGCIMPAGTTVAAARGAGWSADADADADAVAGRAADGARAVPHAAVSPTISRPPHAVANTLFI